MSSTTTSPSPVEAPYTGHRLLELPLYNKGTAFTEEERAELGLVGLLPPHVETLEEQAARAYAAYQQEPNDLARHTYLRNRQDENETLFYKLLSDHVVEMTPMVYTPIVGAACQMFSQIYRRPRGLFLSYPHQDDMEAMLDNAVPPRVEAIVVTDGERILGLGDQGVDGLGIPIGKLSLYTVCGGVDPATTLPIVLDTGTNNKERRENPHYLGWRHERIGDQEYYAFVDRFVQAVKKKWPNVLLQFEDFARPHAEPLLSKYRDQLCCFNDDIQGTATVALGTVMAAVKAAGETLSNQRIAILGGGSAGCGIAEMLVAGMVAEGSSDEEARSRFYVVDRYGLLLEGQADLTSAQQRFLRKASDVEGWDGTNLEAVAKHARPTVLIGVSGQPGTFTESVVKAMAAHTERPIILPLSNPTSQSEAVPADLLAWTNGKALVATGTPFAPVTINGTTHHISQCNNIFIFPGLSQGVISSGASRVSDSMFLEAARALTECSPAVRHPGGSLLPTLDTVQETSRAVAVAVARQAQKEGLAREHGDPEELVAARWWNPEYRPFVRKR